MLGKVEDKRIRGAAEDKMTRYSHKLSGHEFEQTLGDSEGQGRPDVLQLMRSRRVGHDLVTE